MCMTDHLFAENRNPNAKPNASQAQMAEKGFLNGAELCLAKAQSGCRQLIAAEHT